MLGPAVVPSLVRSTRAGRLLCLWPAPPRWCAAFALSSEAGAPGLLLTLLASAALAEPPGAWFPVLGQHEERLADPRVTAISGRAPRCSGFRRHGLCSPRQRSCRDEKGWNLPLEAPTLAPAAPHRSCWFPCSLDVIPRPGDGSIAHDGDAGKSLEALLGHGPENGGRVGPFCPLRIPLAGSARC